jgi:O-antigen ligase
MNRYGAALPRAVEGAALLAPVLAIYANKGLSPLMAILGAAALFALARANSWRAVAALPPVRALAALLVWALLSAIWALDARDALSTFAGAATMAVGGVAFAMAAYLTPHGDLRRLAFALAFGLGLSLAAALDYAHGHAMHRMLWAMQGLERQWAPAGINTGLTLLVLAVFPAAVTFWRCGWKLPAVAALLAVAAVVLPASAVTPRLALLAGIAVLGLAFWLGRAVVMTMVAAVAASTLFAPVLVATLLRPEVHEAWLANRSFSGLHRLHIWQFVVRRIDDKPLLGWGMDSARSMPGGSDQLLGDHAALPLHPHNAALQLWVELGAVGAVLMAILAVVVGRAIWRLADPVARAGAAAVLAAAYVILSASFGVWQNWWLAALGIVAALTIAACQWPPRPGAAT